MGLYQQSLSNRAGEHPRGIRRTLNVKQYLPPPAVAQTLGAGYNGIMRVLAYWSVVNSVILLMLAWHSDLGSFLVSKFPWLTLPAFLIGVGIVAGCVMMIDLFFIYPAVVAFANRQTVLHRNPIYDEMVKRVDFDKAINKVAWRTDLARLATKEDLENLAAKIAEELKKRA